MAKIELPSKITKELWFYKDNEELLKPHLNKFYISYSSVTGWKDYQEDFIKGKLAKIDIPGGIYSSLGNWLGEAVETGKFGENPHGFTGKENIDLKKLRPKNAEYEKMVIIDFEDFIFLGFIDVYHEYEKDTVHIRDMKTGGKNKDEYYASEEYDQVVLYAKAIEEMTGKKIGKTDVYFIRREKSHYNPPLHLSTEQFEIPIEYNEKRVAAAYKKVEKAVKEISSITKTYNKIFG